MTYSDWIAEYVAGQVTLLGRCLDATAKMANAFPELRIAKGHVEVLGWGRRGHAWMVAADGAIVDPTAGQFPGIFEYEEWKPGDEVRVGKCMNCGADIWRAVETLDADHGGASSCGSRCEAELVEWMG